MVVSFGTRVVHHTRHHRIDVLFQSVRCHLFSSVPSLSCSWFTSRNIKRSRPSRHYMNCKNAISIFPSPSKIFSTKTFSYAGDFRNDYTTIQEKSFIDSTNNHDNLQRKYHSTITGETGDNQQKNNRSIKYDPPENDLKTNRNNNIRGTIPLHGKGILIGQYSECHRIFTQEDVTNFGTLIGDLNPVHFPSPDEGTAKTNDKTNNTGHENVNNTHDRKNKDHKAIVHGILLSSLFSTIFGTLVPGSIYRSQTLIFHSAVCVHEPVVGRVTVVKVKEIRGRKSRNIEGGVLCNCDTKIVKYVNADPEGDSGEFLEGEEVVCVSGEAQVWLPGATLGDVADCD